MPTSVSQLQRVSATITSLSPLTAGTNPSSRIWDRWGGPRSPISAKGGSDCPTSSGRCWAPASQTASYRCSTPAATSPSRSSCPNATTLPQNTLKGSKLSTRAPTMREMPRSCCPLSPSRAPNSPDSLPGNRRRQPPTPPRGRLSPGYLAPAHSGWSCSDSISAPESRLL